MGAEGIIRLRSTYRDMTLTISARVPSDVPSSPSFGVEFNGKPIDRIEASDIIARTYTISAARQGRDEWSTIRITASSTFSRHDLDPQAEDRRRLSLALYDVSWEAK
jgi:hypothetical protein